MSKPTTLFTPSKKERLFEINTTASHVVEYTKNLPPFTGVARSIQCFENSGYRNFRILTLHLVEDTIVKTIYSDPYAIWEAISRLELLTYESALRLNGNWNDKEVFQMEFKK